MPNESYASASIDVSYIQHNMYCDGLSAATCSKVNTLRNTGYQERTKCLNVTVEVFGGQIVARGSSCV